LQQLKIRLEGIDTPEKGQSYGDKARQELSRLVFGKSVKVETAGKDRYGRTLGRVHVAHRAEHGQSRLCCHRATRPRQQNRPSRPEAAMRATRPRSQAAA
jgi:hypothetical protein